MKMVNITEAIDKIVGRCGASGRVYAPGCSAEPRALVDAFRRTPHRAAGLTFVGVWIPGVNKVDYAGLTETTRSETIFLSPQLRESFTAGRVDFRPLAYSQAFRWLAETPLDCAIVTVSSPDSAGNVSPGVSADFSTAVWSRPDVLKIALVNREMPAPRHSPRIALESFDICVEVASSILEYDPGAPSPVFGAIAAHIARLIDDGDTLQFGLGNVQLAVLKALGARRKLRVHSGMISDPVLDAIEAGAIADDENAITAGVALGSRLLYDFAGRDARIRFLPVSETHAHATLAGINRFTAINSAIEIDLFGQANAEFIGDKLVSGAGGLVDFLRGAAAAPNGKPIVALQSSARDGAVSRIMPKLPTAAVSVARADIGIVVTEYGIADLRGATMDERAQKLIGIAHPDHRQGLARDWATMKEAI